MSVVGSVKKKKKITQNLKNFQINKQTGNIVKIIYTRSKEVNF